VLDCLATHEVKATFFVIGEKVSLPQERAIARRAEAEGHWIGDHTYTHTCPLGERDDMKAIDELERTEEALSWLEQPTDCVPILPGKIKLPLHTCVA
jgi:peptidoglycan/xylan/chitin deacetylase (PgdA/CDA1 family)